MRYYNDVIKNGEPPPHTHTHALYPTTILSVSQMFHSQLYFFLNILSFCIQDKKNFYVSLWTFSQTIQLCDVKKSHETS